MPNSMPPISFLGDWFKDIAFRHQRANPLQARRREHTIAAMSEEAPTLFRRPGCEKVAPAGQFEARVEACNLPPMTDGLSTLYQAYKRAGVAGRSEEWVTIAPRQPRRGGPAAPDRPAPAPPRHQPPPGRAQG